MGTRHLITVISKGETKVAQYGQWDGYPSGQGVDVLSFLRNKNFNVEAFQAKVDKLKFLQEGEETTLDERPFLSRDLGAKILPAIYFGKYKERISYSDRFKTVECDVDVLVDNSDFANDSFCEWAYTIDLDKKILEVYKYRTLAKTYDLAKLPTKKKFLKDLEE